MQPIVMVMTWCFYEPVSLTHMWFTFRGQYRKNLGASFLAKPKTIEAGGLGGAVSPPVGPGWYLGERVGANLPNNFAFFLV